MTGYTYDAGYKTKSICFNNDKIKGNEELSMVIVNCTLLHKQNDECMYFSACRKYVHKTQLLIYTEILILN
jgi:hypothetical protein